MDFEKWLAEQADDVKAMLTEHTGGLKTALEKERAARKAAEDAKKQRDAADEEAERKRLADAAEWKTLAEKHAADLAAAQAKLAEYDTLPGKLEATETALKAYLTKERDGLPRHVTELLDKLPITEQLAYIAANREALKPAGEKPNGGPPPTPRPGDPDKLTEEERRKKAFKVQF